MELEQNSESKESLDSVAQAIINIFSNDAETVQDHSLNIFLMKIYKNNLPSKPKRMNSIRLNRFNAFLWKVNSNFFSSNNANTILNQLIIGVLANDRNFLEEQDEETIMSIGKWISRIILLSTQKGFLEGVYELLKFLIEGQKPETLDLLAFEQLLKKQPYYSSFQLDSQDEKQAYIEQSWFSLTSTLNIKAIILQELSIKQIFSILYSKSIQKKNIITLFISYMTNLPNENLSTGIFSEIFLHNELKNPQQLENILQAYQSKCFTHDSLLASISSLVKRQENISIFFQTKFTNTSIEALFIQVLTDYWRKKNIQLLIDTFLSSKILKNLIIIHLIIHSDQLVPKKYIDLLFADGNLRFQQAIIISLALTYNHDRKIATQLINKYFSQLSLTNDRKSYFLRAIHYLFSQVDKKALFSNLLTEVTFTDVINATNFKFIPLSEIKMDKLTAQQKTKLLKILSDFTDSSQVTMKIKLDLWYLCNHWNQIGKRIRELDQIIQRSPEQILLYLSPQQETKDIEQYAALLMALNNKLKLYFITQPKQDLIRILVSVYSKYYRNFGRSIALYSNIPQSSKLSNYYNSLFRYCLHSKKRVSSLPDVIGDLMSGELNYKRVEGIQFADYLVTIPEKRGPLDDLWAGKKIAYEMKQLIDVVINFNGSSSNYKKEIKGMFDPQWMNHLAFDVLRTYFQAEIHDQNVLKEMLSICQPHYDFFERVQKFVTTENDNYVDILFFMPEILKEIYPEAITFLAALVDTQISKKDVQKASDKKKSTRKKKSEKVIEIDTSDNIMDNITLFDIMIKRKQLKSLFGESSQLKSFKPLVKILGKINDQMNRLQRVVNEWLPSIKIFHCERGELFQSWAEKLQSYCELWNFFLAKKHFKISIEELQRHFHILTEFLNNIYEEKKSLPELQEKILLTLLLIHQASLTKQTQEKQIPTQDLKNFFLGYHLPPTSQHHFYHCYTCSLPICQICMPFLHKNHDINYLGKDGYCVHDTNQKRKSDRQDERPPRQERERNPRQMQRYVAINNNSNIFQAPPYTSLMRTQRREEDLFFPNFELPDDEMQFGEHLRFKQIMQLRMKEQRQREKQREKQKELYISRQKEKILKEKEQFLMLIERQKLENDGQESQIRSSSSKSIRNIAIGQFKKPCFIPEFNPFPDKIKNYRKTINTKPLRCILQRQLHSHSSSQSNNLEKVKIIVLTTIQKYSFFNKSNYFKYNNRPQYGIMRGMTAGMTNGIRKNLLTSNNKFLAYPNTNNGIVLISMPNMIAKMARRIQLKSYGEMEQERGFLTGSINNSNFSFEPSQIVFNKLNPNLLAIVGVVQLGFAVISNQGKFMKYSDTDFKSSEPISKFIWLSKHKNLFAVSTGNSIRIGHINDEGRAKTVNKFKIQIQKPIRDFEANLEGGGIYLYIIDNEGEFYRTEFDYKGSRVLNVNDKKVTYPQNIQKIQSLIFADKKILLSCENGKMYLLRVEAKMYPPSFQQSFDIEAALRSHESTKFIKPPYYLSQPNIIQANQSFFSIIGIVKRVGTDPKKRGGILMLIRVNSKNSMQVFLLHEQDNIEGYESIQISENTYLITAVDENGNMFCFNYNIPIELYTSKEAVNAVVDDSTVKTCNGLIKDMHILEITKYCDPKKYDNFKETKDISFHYKTTIGLSESIHLVTNDPFKYFWTGLAITVQPKDNNSEGFFQYELFGELYTFVVPKGREIQIPLNIKETLRIFTEDGQFVLQTRTNLELKSIKVHGVQYNLDSAYKKIYTNLNKLVMTNLAYNPNNLEDYLQNPDRNDISTVNLTKIMDLKQTHKYDAKQLNLLMKLQLLRESIDQNSISNKGQLEDHLDQIKNNLMPQCQKRNYLEKSCRKLVRRLCQLAIPQTQGIIGHPFEYRTFLDIYYFEESYLQWANTRHINHFEHLTNLLFSLIFKRIGNLYIIFKTYPDLIHEMTFFFKTLLNCIKISKNEIRDQVKLQKLISICPNFVAILCEYYQTLKNTSVNQMVDESEQNSDKDQARVLCLFEEIFCATRKELYRQIFISPDVYLQRLYCTPKQSHPILTAISIFQIKDRKQESMQEIKSSHISNSQEVKEEEYIQLDDQSQKQLMGQQQARQMGDFISEQNDDKGNQMSQQESKISNPRKFKKTYEILNNYILPQGGFLNFTYYQFSFNMATALFNLEDYLKEQNVVFYVGFFFNILRIIEMNFDKKRDGDYLANLFEAIYKRIYSVKHSPLFMVLNYFFEPLYGEKVFDSRVIEPSKCRLCEEFVKFLHDKQVSISDIFINFTLEKTAPTISLGQAMKFSSFEIENNLYQLKFLGNLYFNIQLRTIPAQKPNNTFKYKILGGLVRYKLRVLKNIMYFEGWEFDLQEAKVEVGFESLKDNRESGVNILYDCSKNNSEVFIKKLAEDPTKIEVLEGTLLQICDGKISGKILEMLTTYYTN